ncbi:MAG: DNA topoisomerase [Ruminococcaceae bacterium]|nr:DNA topoisomerase [Oscillospiraceae bacterium]
MAKKTGQTPAQYGNESIVSLKGADRVRKRPGVMFGSDGIEGCEHSIFEILSNSIDEARQGYGKKIIITRFADHSVEIVDYGRGVPVDFNTKENAYNWELVFCEMYAGGKYSNDAGESYEYSLGLNGLGLCATQYSSEYMDAEIHRDGYVYRLHFEKGENVGGLSKEPYAKKDTGTRIRWKPDLEVFTDIDVPLEYFLDTVKRQAIVNAGITFVVKDQPSGEEHVFLYEQGIADYVRELAGEETLSSVQVWQTERRGRDREDKPEYSVKINVAVTFSNQVTLTEYYHNSSWLEHGGAPEKAVRAAFVYMIDQRLRQTGKYGKNESKVTYDDVRDCLLIIISSFSNITSYENQTKKSITNRFIQEAMTDFLKKQLEIWFIENPMEADKICAQVLINKQSREQADRQRVSIKKSLSSNMDITSRVAKFVDCRSRDVSERELFIVEGDSAAGSCKQARDPNFQGIMPVRGKILNCLKAEYTRIFKSDIITDLIKVLGCGVDVGAKAKNLPAFDINALRWNKVIICTDADYDGFQIRTLVLTMFYRLMPGLIDAGKVFIAESPLYEITTADQTYFAYNEQEKAEIMEIIGDKKFTIQRSKGLGENNADMMNFTTMNPATRRLIKVMPYDAERTAEMFDILLGDNLSGRKEFITLNGERYIELADVQ